MGDPAAGAGEQTEFRATPTHPAAPTGWRGEGAPVSMEEAGASRGGSGRQWRRGEGAPARR
jgi:hypothetical protein